MVAFVADEHNSDYMIALLRDESTPPLVGLLFFCSWTQSRSLANSLTSNPSPVTKQQSETFSLASFAGLAIRREECRSRAIDQMLRHIARATESRVVFSTHMDTVPPFIPSSEDPERIYGRGARATQKGLSRRRSRRQNDCASKELCRIAASSSGEERDSLGAKVANEYAATEPGLPLPISGKR